MNFLRNVRSSLSGWFPQRDAIMETPTGLGDIYFELIVKTLSWNTRYTLHTLVFWLEFHILMLLKAFNTLGCFFFVLMVFFIVDFLYRPVFAAQYTGQYSDDLKRLKRCCMSGFGSMRHKAAILFYPVISGLLWGLAVISTKVSGLALSLGFILCIYTLPLLVKRLPKTVYDYLESCYRSLGASTSAVAEDELFPYWLNSKEDPEFESLGVEQTADLFTSSMPSYLEVAEPSLVIQEEDLMPHSSKSGMSITPVEISSDSDSETKGIEFQSEHFSSSSSEEDQFLVQNTRTNPLVQRSESDSDYDIIDPDEVSSLNA
ncbi:uncharacterized protein LOC125504030 [Dendroctonus ponderosae]|uniref:Uncharacterized protein n=1 Tax=Dendroctonus ponderosae TaxID=77166 RepID=U4U4K5_DENPD|nr:uncharacterized protein LOC109545417 [Dendroctonus ponderosae]XP_048521275.1 uncharacterized protein LOC125504030 [Dendroctonus ponderosae]ERL83918.1 hypothetical protein D910_01210 [Dendroctonus ponderosae]ERL87992.1 hypothetical protein D910_05381 [Dendroctonus ponderosae]KAH0999105.1 hypothetical protein HUJ05_008655 [Dendroctonus ponderosae]KAH1017784.1 hypothetical protein HUJ05_008381 [Dendroctonus ponderosae]